jgi:histone H3/H4
MAVSQRVALFQKERVLDHPVSVKPADLFLKTPPAAPQKNAPAVNLFGRSNNHRATVTEKETAAEAGDHARDDGEAEEDSATQSEDSSTIAEDEADAESARDEATPSNSPGRPLTEEESYRENDDVGMYNVPSTPVRTPMVDPRHGRMAHRTANITEATSAQPKAAKVAQAVSRRKAAVPAKKTPRTLQVNTAATKTKKNGEPFKKRRFKSSTVARREILRFQKSYVLLIQKLPMERLIREITYDVATGSGIDPPRMKLSAIAALHIAAEDYLTEIFMACACLADHGNRVGISKKDMRMVLALGSIPAVSIAARLNEDLL